MSRMIKPSSEKSVASFSVELDPDGKTFAASPDETILDAALRHGLNLPHSCRGGSCLSCKARVLEGTINYPHDRLPPALDADEAAAGEALLCQAHAGSDVRIRVREVLPASEVRIRRLPCRVVAIEQPADDVRVLHLQLPKVEPFEYRAGQYLDVVLRDGRRRSFSIANPPDAGTPLELHVRHVPGGEFTQWVFESLKLKGLLRIEGPLGGFFLRESAGRPEIFVAGGTGFAPLKAMLLEARSSQRPEQIHLYWGVRHRADLYAADWVSELVSDWPQLSFVPVLSEPAPDDAWSGRVGWVHEAVLEDFPELSGYEVYASGPPPMIEAIQTRFGAAGLDARQLHFDSFEYAPDTLARIGGD